MAEIIEEATASLAAEPGAPTPFDPAGLDIYLQRRGRGGNGVYNALLLLLATCVAVLPLIEVPVYVHARGVLRAEEETHVLLSPSAGSVHWVRPRRHRAIRAGETIVVLDDGELRVRRESARRRHVELEQEVTELTRLLELLEGRSAPPTPASLRYGLEWESLRAERERLLERLTAADRDLRRTTALYERGLAARVDLDAQRDHLTQLRHDSMLLRNRTSSRWRGSLAAARDELRRQAAELTALDRELELRALRSPVDGEIDALAPLARGSLVRPGERIAMITPESRLIVELYVKPEDLSSVEVGTPVRMRLEPYRFSEWGAVVGTVFEIAPYLTQAGERSVGTVRVRPQGTSAPGPLGPLELRRGNAVSARLPAGTRSLWALLRNRRDDRASAAVLPTALPERGVG